MSKVMVRMSTLIKLSVHGKMKKRPAESQECKCFNKGYACRKCNNDNTSPQMWMKAVAGKGPIPAPLSGCSCAVSIGKVAALMSPLSTRGDGISTLTGTFPNETDMWWVCIYLANTTGCISCQGVTHSSRSHPSIPEEKIESVHGFHNISRSRNNRISPSGKQKRLELLAGLLYASHLVT